MKKLFYFLLITSVLLTPIFYWLHNWWGITFSNFFSVQRLMYIYSQDTFLLFTTIINFALYLFAIYKLFKRNEIVKPENVNANIQNENKNETPEFLMKNSSGTSSINWENLYGPNKMVKEEEKITAEKKQEIKEVKSEKIETPNIQTEPATPNIAINSKQEDKKVEQPLPPEKNDNIIDIKQPLNIKDVYKVQISSVLEKNGYKNLGDCVIDNIDIDFIAIADSDTLVLGIINDEYGDIIANEVPNSDEKFPSWFTNEKKYNSPVCEVKTAVVAVEKVIKEVLPEDSEILIKPVVVIPNAVVSNKTDIESKWAEMGVSVVKFLNYSDLPDLMEVLPEKSGTAVLESYQTFVQTLIKYFNKKAKNYPVKKTG